MARGREPDHRALEFINRERDRSPIREIGDMTSDPDSATSRIFVGSLTPNITRPMLENHFSRWGNVIGVTLTKNKFGFVQFGSETEAQVCLAAGPFTIINGDRLDVKPARVGPGQGAAPPPAPGLGNNIMKPGPSGYGGGGGGGGGMWNRRDNYGGGRDHLPPSREDPYYDSYYSSSKSRESEGQRYDDYYRDYYDHPGGGGSSASDSYYRSEIDPRPLPTRSYESPYAYPSPSEPIDPLDAMRPNDVEIVVPNKAQRAYAESIEAQLKRMNLLVDLLFPPPDITPTRVLNDLAERHCLYAIFATTENEKHNSITLNILHGDPQEHRNMPVEDALRLVQRNFEDYVKQTRMRNMRQVVPRDIRNLLLDLLEMRSLSMGDLDKLIKYLRERQNALVDDQIEQKRENAETQSSLVAGGVTVTYPGYNYIASTVPGAVTDTNPASVAAAAAPQSIIPAGAGAPSAVAQSSASMNIVSSPNAAATIAAYPATAYTTTGVIGAYGVTPQSQTQHQIMAPPPPVPAPAPPPPPPPQSKQADLQERILNLMKSQSGLAQGGIPVAAGVPGPPTGVPPPSLVQDARMVQQHQHQHQQQHQHQHQQQHQHQHQQPNQPLWMQHGAPPDNNDKVQGSQHTYNPWSQ